MKNKNKVGGNKHGTQELKHEQTGVCARGYLICVFGLGEVE